MSLFSGPEEHAANPPETWQVARVQVGNHRPTWYLATADGGHLSSAHETRKAAESELSAGFYFDLWHREGRWYAGETPPGHRSWAECKAEQERTHARNVARSLMRCYG